MDFSRPGHRSIPTREDVVQAQELALRSLPLGAADFRTDSLPAAYRTAHPRSTSVPTTLPSSSAPSGLFRTHTLATTTRRLTSQTLPQADLVGLSLVHNPDNAQVDLIFVHGLGGSSLKTWSWQRDPVNFWPAWLKDEITLPDLRVFTFGYTANILGPDNSMSILDFAKDLLNRIQGYHDDEVPIGHRPIVFVAHSMGGLVVKKAYIIGRHDTHYGEMLAQVRGIMFLSTPHRGSASASTLKTLLSATLGKDKTYISELKNNSTSIEDLNEQFRGACEHLQLVSIYETKPTKIATGIKRTIVDKDSGRLDYPKEISSPLHADHHTVCKFESTTDQNYIVVVGLLKQLLDCLDIRRVPRSAFPSMSNLESGHEHPSALIGRILGITEASRDELRKAINVALPGSCQWFRERKTFANWISGKSNSPSILWLSGMPGTGKSTLAALMIDHMQKRFLEQSTQFHFFVNSQPGTRSIAACLLSIAFQLAESNGAFAEKLIDLHRTTGLHFRNQKAVTIWERIFQYIVFNMEFGYCLHWVVDAIDEAENADVLVKMFMGIKSRTPIRVLFLSRPNSELSNYTVAHADIVQHDVLTIGDTKNDIAAYVKVAIQEAMPHDQRIQQDTTRQILGMAQGSFLWVSLALSMLRDNWHTKQEIFSSLNNVPRDMQRLYMNMVDVMRTQNGGHHYTMALRILTWATCNYRPLRIEELEEALHPDFQNFTSLRNTIVRICSHFIRVDDGTISLIHATARHFLLNESEAEPPVVDFHQGHDHIALVCLRYLSSDQWWRLTSQALEQGTAVGEDRLASLYRTFPLLQYSINHWSYHVSHATPILSSELAAQMRQFFDRYVLSWIQLVAASQHLKVIITAAKHLKAFLRRRKRKLQSELSLDLNSANATAEDSNLMVLESWIIDLIRLVGKFGSDLIVNPSIIHRLVPPLCPVDSIIFQTYANSSESLLSIKGVSARGWDDCLARVSVGQDFSLSKVVASELYFVTLVSSDGTLVVWHAETCEEVHRLRHNEWVLLISMNRTGTLLASAGRFSFKIWDISRGTVLHRIDRTSEAKLMFLDFADDDTEIIVGYDDCRIVRMNVESGAEMYSFSADEDPGMNHSCPRFMSLSPDHTKLVLAYRGAPVLLWNLKSAAGTRPKRCLRSEDEDKWDYEEGEVWNAAEVVRWHPESTSLLVLYQDATILHWNVIDDVKHEFRHTDAREIVINHDGTFVLSSDRSGALSVWTLPKIQLLYRLEYEDFVRDLCFSPDGQRIYDVRGSRCNVWEPDVLIRPEELGNDVDRASNCDASVLSDPVISERNDKPLITSMACGSEDEFYVLGKEDGTVQLYDLQKGTKVKKLYSHADTVSVIALAWSISRKYMISGDDSGKVIAKRLKIKEDGKWAVFPALDFRLNETVEQFVFSEDGTRVLVSTTSSDQVWDLRKKSQLCSRSWTGRSGRKWISHPLDQDQLIWIDPNHTHIFSWANLERTTSPCVCCVEDVTQQISHEHLAKSCVQTVLQPLSRRHIVCETLPDTGNSRSSAVGSLAVSLISVADHAKGGKRTPHLIDRWTLPELGKLVQRLLGCYKDKIVFLDRLNWVCTWEILGPMTMASSNTNVPRSPMQFMSDTVGNVKAHFFLPKDWLGVDSLPLIAMSPHGTLLCPRDGEVVIVGYNGRL